MAMAGEVSYIEKHSTLTSKPIAVEMLIPMWNRGPRVMNATTIQHVEHVVSRFFKKNETSVPETTMTISERFRFLLEHVGNQCRIYPD